MTRHSAHSGRCSRAYRAPAGGGDVLRRQLLDATEALLIEKGDITQVSLRQVARTVGVSATSVYLHFADKDEMVLEVCQRRFTEFVTLLRSARAQHEGPVEQLRACGAVYVQFGVDHPEQYKLLFGGLSMEAALQRVAPEDLVGLQALQEIAAIVQSGVTAGAFRPVEPFDTAVTLWALVHGLVGVITHGHDKPIDPAALIVSSLELILVGLRA